MLKREWGAESNGKLPHLSIPSKTADLIPEFAEEDLLLKRTATLVPIQEGPAFGQNTLMIIYIYIYIYYFESLTIAIEVFTSAVRS